MATQLLLSLVFVFGFLYATEEAHARLSSFISSLLFEPANSQEVEKIHANSQNMDILEAIPAQNPSLGNGDITIVDETALESQDDPSGGALVYPQGDQISVYVVRKGDTISQIAQMYGVSVNTILWANDLENRTLSEGQTITILPISGVRHIVKKGETIESITKKHGGKLDEVLRFNNLSASSRLSIGDEIIVPDGESAPEPTPTKTTSGTTKVAAKPAAATKFSNLPDHSGYYMRPISGGRRTQGIHGYNGVDLAHVIGTPVVASASGKVIVSKNSGWNGGYGNYIVILHGNGTQTLYGHLKQSIVAANSQVEKGQVIGYLGSTGNSTGPHIHFEIRGAKNPF